MNSVISAIPLYTGCHFIGKATSMYRMPSCQQELDRLRRIILWNGGNTVRKKSSLVAWKAVRAKFSASYSPNFHISYAEGKNSEARRGGKKEYTV